MKCCIGQWHRRHGTQITKVSGSNRLLIAFAPFRNTGREDVDKCMTHSPRVLHIFHVPLTNLSFRTIFPYFFLRLRLLLIVHNFFAAIVRSFSHPSISAATVCFPLFLLYAPSVSSSSAISGLLYLLDLLSFFPRDSLRWVSSELEILMLTRLTNTTSVVSPDLHSLLLRLPSNMLVNVPCEIRKPRPNHGVEVHL